MESKVTRKTGEGRVVLKVQSRSNPTMHHYVDVRTQSCSCKGFSYRGECRHLRLVNAEPYTVTARHDSRHGSLVYDIHDGDGSWEGALPSYADAHDVVTEDLGGYIANYPGAA